MDLRLFKQKHLGIGRKALQRVRCATVLVEPSGYMLHEGVNLDTERLRSRLRR
jgi:hypothetical protein